MLGYTTVRYHFSGRIEFLRLTVVMGRCIAFGLRIRYRARISFRNVTRRDNVVTYMFTLCRVMRFFPSSEDQAADSPDTRISRGTATPSGHGLLRTQLRRPAQYPRTGDAENAGPENAGPAFSK